MIATSEFTEAERTFVSSIALRLDSAAAAEFGEPERMILVSMMRNVGMAEYPPVLGDPAGERACGDCICERCRKPYFEHPYDWRVIGYGNVPFLNVLCNGLRVKL